MPPCPAPCISPPCTCLDPPCTHIQEPTAYAVWAQTKEFFGPGFSTTYTVINQYPDKTNYYAYGYTKAETERRRHFWFFIKMSASEATELELAHKAWRESTGSIQHQILRDQPPECGTPNTNPCPPDPLLAGTMRYLRDLKAGAGAGIEKLAEAAQEVEKLLLAELEQVAKELGEVLPPLPLEAAIHHLRSLKAGPHRDAAALDHIAREIEEHLFHVLEAQAQLLRPAL